MTDMRTAGGGCIVHTLVAARKLPCWFCGRMGPSQPPGPQGLGDIYGMAHADPRPWQRLPNGFGITCTLAEWSMPFALHDM